MFPKGVIRYWSSKDLARLRVRYLCIVLLPAVVPEIVVPEIEHYNRLYPSEDIRAEGVLMWRQPLFARTLMHSRDLCRFPD